jgi:hypothetical protein
MFTRNWLTCVGKWGSPPTRIVSVGARAGVSRTSDMLVALPGSGLVTGGVAQRLGSGRESAKHGEPREVLSGT